jgi:TonB family protein
LALLFFLTAPCLCQTPRKEKVSPECKHRALLSKAGPTGPYKFLPGETYKQSPTVKFQINEDGTVSKVKLIRSSGVKDIDKQVVTTVSGWKFKAVPGCVLDSEMTVLIHWE